MSITRKFAGPGEKQAALVMQSLCYREYWMEQARTSEGISRTFSARYARYWNKCMVRELMLYRRISQ